MVFTPEFSSKINPLRERVCLKSFESSVLFRPIDPSLNVEQIKMFGYAVSSAPSELSGIEPNVFVILYVGNP